MAVPTVSIAPTNRWNDRRGFSAKTEASPKPLLCVSPLRNGASDLYLAAEEIWSLVERVAPDLVALRGSVKELRRQARHQPAKKLRLCRRQRARAKRSLPGRAPPARRSAFL